jgi:hypothetical protein
MKILATMGMAFLLLLMTASVPRLNAQEREDERNGAKNVPEQQQQQRPQDDRGNQAGQEPRAKTPDAQKNDADRQRSDQERTNQTETARPQHEQRQPPQTERNERRPVQAQRGKRIPDDRFRSSFGPQHTFRVQRAQVINVSQPVIVVGGYSFEFLDPWPADWAFDDPCYIDYADDEYFLFDTMHPGMRIALIVVNVD